MRRARDVREQIEGLMTRVEIEMVSNAAEDIGIRKVVILNCFNFTWLFVIDWLLQAL